MATYEDQLDELRTRVKNHELRNLDPVEKAVWAAAYVQILGANPHRQDIHLAFEMLAEPTEHRALLAIEGANNAVTALRKHFKTTELL